MGDASASQPAKPNVLFIHGSWHQPSHFDRVRALFETAGYPTSCPPLATSRALPPIGVPEDALRIEDELNRLIDQEGKEVIVVGHSYGGLIMTEAVKSKYSSKSRQSQNQPGGVLHLVYMCAFMIPNKTSLSDTFGGALPPWIVINSDNGQCHVANAAQIFYNDLTPEQQEHQASQLVNVPFVSQEQPLSNAAYLDYPVTYLYCENDQALPYEVQQMMVRNTMAATGIHVNEENCSAGHSPFLSMPEKVLEVVEKLKSN